MFAATAFAQSYAPPASKTAADGRLSFTRYAAPAAPLVAGAPARAEEAAPPAARQQDAILKSCEQAVDELKLRRAQVQSFEAQTSLMGEQLKLYDQLVARERERGDLYKEAAEARSGANTVDERRDQLRVEQVAMFKDEVERLRRENDRLRNPGFLRSLFSPDTVWKVGGGYALGRLTH